MTLMFSYCKNTSLACNIKDGYTAKKAEADKKEPLLKRREVAFLVKEMPSFYDYMAYMYFCGSAISGPWFEYKDLYDFMRAQGHYKHVHKVSTFWPSIFKVFMVVCCTLVGTVIGILGFDLGHLTTPAFGTYSLP